jgi:hypothetical protein
MKNVKAMIKSVMVIETEGDIMFTTIHPLTGKLVIIPVIGRPVLAIDNYDNDYLDKLPQSVIDYLYDEFLLIDSEQIEMIDDTSGIKDLVHDNLLRIKYRVMKATNALPTEQCVKDMNIYQWLWYYYNLVEDKNEKEKDEKLKIDYLAMFINPQLSKQIKDERDAQNQQGIINNNNVKTTTEHTEVNPNNPNEITIYKDTNVDKDFDAKIQAVIGASDDKFTVLPDDVVKGNVAESKQDFIQKVIQNAQLEEQENKK